MKKHLITLLKRIKSILLSEELILLVVYFGFLLLLTFGFSMLCTIWKALIN